MEIKKKIITSEMVKKCLIFNRKSRVKDVYKRQVYGIS